MQMEKKKNYAELCTSVYGHALHFTHRTRINLDSLKKIMEEEPWFQKYSEECNRIQ